MIDLISLQFARMRNAGVRLDEMWDTMHRNRLHMPDRPTKFESEYLYVIRGYEAFRFKFEDQQGNRYFKRIDMNPNHTLPDGTKAYASFDDFVAAVERLGIPLALAEAWVSRIDYCVDVPVLPRDVLRGLDVPRLLKGSSFDKGRATGPDGYRLGSNRSIAVYDKRRIGERNVAALSNRSQPWTRIEARFRGGGTSNPYVPQGIRRIRSFEDIRTHARAIIDAVGPNPFHPFDGVQVHRVEVEYPHLMDVRNRTVDLNEPLVRNSLARYHREYPSRHRVDVLLDAMSYSELRKRMRDENGERLDALSYVHRSQGLNLRERMDMSLERFFFGRRPRPNHVYSDENLMRPR